MLHDLSDSSRPNGFPRSWQRRYRYTPADVVSLPMTDKEYAMQFIEIEDIKVDETAFTCGSYNTN